MASGVQVKQRGRLLVSYCFFHRIGRIFIPLVRTYVLHAHWSKFRIKTTKYACIGIRRRSGCWFRSAADDKPAVDGHDDTVDHGGLVAQKEDDRVNHVGGLWKKKERNNVSYFTCGKKATFHIPTNFFIGIFFFMASPLSPPQWALPISVKTTVGFTELVRI